ncbi:MAG: hypothetical protein K8R77_07030 [Anaerolineaceae bacterium]|nr:hypothetical protein [Anaerolineaceae bacterium]
MLAEGLPNQEIAQRLVIALRTVKDPYQQSLPQARGAEPHASSQSSQETEAALSGKPSTPCECIALARCFCFSTPLIHISVDYKRPLC